MTLAVVGLSHHTAPVEVRERYVFGRKEASAILAALTAGGVAEEAVLLSTCNRAELYLRLGAGRGLDAAVELFAARAGYSRAEAEEHLYRHVGRRAVEHLFRVTSSLDSMVVGEAQIQGQVRTAYEAAQGGGGGERAVGPVLSRLFEMALHTGGRVRSETALGVGAASVPSVAVELAKKIFGSLRGRRAMVLGAGEMSELMLECLVAEGVESLVVANRTEARAREITARFGGRPVRYDEMLMALPEVDIVAAATAAPHVVLTREMVESVLPGGPRHPLCVLDIALPRDVDPAVGEMDNIFLYDVDDLQQIVEGNLERRRADIPRAEALIAEGVEAFWAWYVSRDVAPLIRELRERAERVRQAEVERVMRKLAHLGEADREAVEALTKQILNKVLHDPTVRLREAAADGNAVQVVEAARYLFRLREQPGGTVE
ncbi:MAG TPA: glutamyl-tRNA reductase [Longimicrobiales bacterium]|nr:glutamyl-tRNA reductase [Longimicrobiales bacterium]